MPTRRNDTLGAHLNECFQIASDSINRIGTMSIESALILDSLSFSLEIATEELTEEAAPESSDELDNFLKEFALKEVF